MLLSGGQRDPTGVVARQVSGHDRFDPMRSFCDRALHGLKWSTAEGKVWDINAVTESDWHDGLRQERTFGQKWLPMG